MISTVSACARAVRWVVVGPFCVFTSVVQATLIVDPPLPITHQVEVQIIQTALDNGSQPATIFGDAAQRASIEAGVDTVWAQAGIDIKFLPTIVNYDNTFAFQGNGGTRPTSDLDTILSNATSAGIANSTPNVINMFFVEIVPGFSFTSENSANGIAKIGADGIAQFAGENLLTFQNGRDVISSVVAHEIGHNLGLKHTANGGANLMSPNGASEQLTEQQINAIFQTTFRNDSVAFIPSGGTGFPVSAPVIEYAADFNGDNRVDDVDRQWWETSYGTNNNADADKDGDSDGIDFLYLQSQFGSGVPPLGIVANVPEPPTTVLLIAAVFWLVSSRAGEGNRTLA